MVARYIHDGSAIDYRPTADVAAGDVVVQGSLIGVARLDIAAGELGALATVGVYDVAKATGTALAVGAKVYWDATNASVSTTTTNPLLGIVVAEAATDDTTVRVLINP